MENGFPGHVPGPKSTCKNDPSSQPGVTSTRQQTGSDDNGDKLLATSGGVINGPRVPVWLDAFPGTSRTRHM